ncbi:MAG: universal stress protein [Halobacteriaceae archaeon]
MYDRILVPTDGSPSTRWAVEHALAFAAAHDATVHALYVLDLRYLSTDAEEFSDVSAVEDALEEEGRDAVERVAERGREVGVEVETHVREGVPSRAIVRDAEEHDADLVAMGTHGRSGVERFLLGSVAERVVRHSPVPVLTARAGEGDPDTDYEELLVPTDGSEDALGAVEHALDAAERFDARVHALSVVDTRVSRQTNFLDALEQVGRQATKDVEVRAAERGVDVVTEVVEGNPSDAILDYADEEGVDLVAMGTSGRTGLDRVLVGSVAERVVRGATMPVLTVRTPDE